jgi:hypothetical protein
VPARVNADHDESDTRGHGAQRTLYQTAETLTHLAITQLGKDLRIPLDNHTFFVMKVWQTHRPVSQRLCILVLLARGIATACAPIARRRRA